jgi:(p)ppGpp synthase/HD superfamily hydrolase
VSAASAAAQFANDLPTAQAAVAYADRVHTGQRRRYDGAPFIRHPLEVGRLLRDAGAGEELIAAGILHDVLETERVTVQELGAVFGARVAALVASVTEDSAITGYAKRKAALRLQVARAGDEALLLFAADKVSKVRELRASGAAPPPRRVAHYRRSLELLEQRRPGCAMTRRLARELARIDAPARALA